MNGFTITGKENLEFFRLCQMRGALRLEVLGMKHSRGSVYALVKRELGFKGNKQKVLDQLCALIEQRKEERDANH